MLPRLARMRGLMWMQKCCPVSTLVTPLMMLLDKQGIKLETPYNIYKLHPDPQVGQHRSRDSKLFTSTHPRW